MCHSRSASVKLIIGTKHVHLRADNINASDTVHYLNHNKSTYLLWNGQRAKHSQQKVNQTKNHARSLGGEQIRYCQYQVWDANWSLEQNAYTLGASKMRQTRFDHLNHNNVRTCYERAACQMQSAKGESNKKITHSSLGGKQIRYFQHQVEIGHWNKARTLCWCTLRRTRSASTEVRFQGARTPWWGIREGLHQSIQVCTYVVLWLGNGLDMLVCGVETITHRNVPPVSTDETWSADSFGSISQAGVKMAITRTEIITVLMLERRILWVNMFWECSKRVIRSGHLGR